MTDKLKSETKKESKKRAPRGEKMTAKERYAADKTAGRCVDCHKRQAKKDRVQCQICISKTAERAAARAAKRAKKNK